MSTRSRTPGCTTLRTKRTQRCRLPAIWHPRHRDVRNYQTAFPRLTLSQAYAYVSPPGLPPPPQGSLPACGACALAGRAWRPLDGDSEFPDVTDHVLPFRSPPGHFHVLPPLPSSDPEGGIHPGGSRGRPPACLMPGHDIGRDDRSLHPRPPATPEPGRRSLFIQGPGVIWRISLLPQSPT